MSVFFTSDTHFGHERIIDLCSRPFSSVDEMNETLIANWNSVVGPNDRVFHMGDFIMGTFAENVKIIERLNGEIVLTPGNHDRMSSVYHAKPNKKATWTKEYTDRGVIVMPEVWSVQFPTTPVTMSHYPFSGDSHEEDRFPEMRPEDDGSFLIHGHVHEKWKVNGRQINVGVDVWDFTPVSVDQMSEEIIGIKQRSVH